MIVCDADNIHGPNQQPTPEVIRRQWLEQTEALKDVRRRLQDVIDPSAAGRLTQFRITA